MKRYHFILFLVVPIFILLSCKKVTEKNDVIASARYLLNQSQYEETIEFLSTDEAKSDPRSELKILRASALAGSVGLNLIDSFPAFQEFLFNAPAAPDLKSKAASAGNIDAASNNLKDNEAAIQDQKNAEREILNFLNGISTGAKVIFGIKWIHPQKRARMFLALSELEKIQKDDTNFKMAVAYRIIIYSSIFMSVFRDSLPEPDKTPSNALRFFCEMNIPRFAEDVHRMRKILSLIQNAYGEIPRSETENSTALKKMLGFVNRLREFFERNRSPLQRVYFLQGLLRNEVCS